MQTLQNMWLFFQDQVLGMKWLNALIGNIISSFGLDVSSRIDEKLDASAYTT